MQRALAWCRRRLTPPPVRPPRRPPARPRSDPPTFDSRSTRIADERRAPMADHRARFTALASHAPTASRMAAATSTSRSFKTGCPADARYTRNSRFPAGPGSEESHTPRTASARPVTKSHTSCTAPCTNGGITHHSASHLARDRPRTGASRAATPRHRSPCTRTRPGSTVRQRDERDVHGQEVGANGSMPGGQRAGVDPLHRGHPWIARTQSLVKLVSVPRPRRSRPSRHGPAGSR